MEVLFVRHGETESNRKHRHQMPEEPLSMRGIDQARLVAPKVTDWKPTHIITSPHQRARQTAEVIADYADLPVHTHDEFRELRRPISVMGKRHGGYASVWYMIHWFFSGLMQHDNARQGESYSTFLKRIERARAILESYPKDARVVVVSHAVFINFFIEHACREEKISLIRSLPQLLKIFALENSAYIQLHFTNPAAPGTCAWQLVKNEIDIQELEKKRAHTKKSKQSNAA